MFALLPLPILVWWLLPPYRARQASVQVPFFDRLAAATGQTPQRGAVVLQRRAAQMIAAIADLDPDRRGAGAAAMGRRSRHARGLRARPDPCRRYFGVDGPDRFPHAGWPDADPARRRQARHQGFHRAPPRRPHRADPVRHQGLCAGAVHAGSADRAATARSDPGRHGRAADRDRRHHRACDQDAGRQHAPSRSS